jgi:cytochrome c
MTTTIKLRLTLGAACVAWAGLVPGAFAANVDEAAAEALAKKSGCLKCHSVAREKDAPSYKKIAAKYKGQADAEQKLVTFVTTGPKVKVEGKEETHEALKTKNEGDVRNVVSWILTR